MAEPKDSPAPKRRAKKRRKKRGGVEPGDASGPDASARHGARPPFAMGFPDDPVIDHLLLAFDVGNYAHVRAEARRLVDQSEDPAMRHAGKELLRRIQPDPVSAYLIGLAAVLLCFFSFWYWTHPHP